MNRRNNTCFILLTALLLALVICVTSCVTVPGVKDVYIKEFSEWDLHSELQQKYLYGSDISKASSYADGSKELSYPVSPEFEWSYGNGLDASSISEIHVVLSEDRLLSDPVVMTPRTVATYYIEKNGGLNLKANTTYYWQVQLYDNQGVLHSSTISSFKTLTAPRTIYIDGIANCRDIGGYVTESGKTVRQGMIYRCGKLNDNYTTKCTVTPAGLETIEKLGIRTEIDFRGNTKSVDGTVTYINGYAKGTAESSMKSAAPSIENYVHAPIIYDDLILDMVDARKQYRHAFQVLADESNYPLLYHCSIGTDRTGVFSILLEKLLGVKEEDVIRDYLFSNFGAIGSKRELSKYKLITASLAKYPGKTEAERTQNYLLAIGVTQEEIDSFRKIMLGR
ncbi:MAG: tyrosine-protein phosphatase [Spirochaetales bacterium]|nr:tyrosine-protein phosphatase [Spirochaetales bacterium]